MLSDRNQLLSSTRLSIVGSSEKTLASSEQTISRKKRRSFEGFSEEDILTTKKVQKLYYEKFGVNRVSQDEVASRVGWSQSTLNLYINGKQKIGDTALRRFCDLFGVTPDQLSVKYKPSTNSQQSLSEISEMRDILAELIKAVDGKRDLNLIIMRAKNIVNE